jgi:hypothetical protein
MTKEAADKNKEGLEKKNIDQGDKCDKNLKRNMLGRVFRSIVYVLTAIMK